MVLDNHTVWPIPGSLTVSSIRNLGSIVALIAIAIIVSLVDLLVTALLLVVISLSARLLLVAHIGGPIVAILVTAEAITVVLPTILIGGCSRLKFRLFVPQDGFRMRLSIFLVVIAHRNPVVEFTAAIHSQVSIFTLPLLLRGDPRSSLLVPGRRIGLKLGLKFSEVLLVAKRLGSLSA